PTAPALLLAGLLELGQGLLAGVVGAPGIESADRRLHRRGDLLQTHEHVGDLGAALELLIARAGEEARVQEVVFRARVLIEAALRTVVIGEHQPVGRDEGGGAVRQARRRGAHALEPRGAQVGAVPALDELARKIDRKSTRLNSSHVAISYAVFCLKKKKKINDRIITHTKY